MRIINFYVKFSTYLLFLEGQIGRKNASEEIYNSSCTKNVTSSALVIGRKRPFVFVKLQSCLDQIICQKMRKPGEKGFSELENGELKCMKEKIYYVKIYKRTTLARVAPL